MLIRLLTAALFAIACAAHAQRSPSASATPTPPPPACVSPEFRQFDFWLGHWKVTNSKGVQVGTSEITRVSEGCAVREQWQSAQDQGGTSINYYDAADKQWHQIGWAVTAPFSIFMAD
jgi:hypothetical protein